MAEGGGLLSALVQLEFVGPSGASWNVHLARLPSGGLFVYSPAWLGDDTFAQIEKHGTPEVLFAPNTDRRRARGRDVPERGGELIFCDAFAHFTRPITGLVGVALRLFHASGGLAIGTPFKHFGISDRAKYKQWLFAMLDREQPKTVHFSHGDPLSGPDVVRSLKEVSERRL